MTETLNSTVQFVPNWESFSASNKSPILCVFHNVENVVAKAVSSPSLLGIQPIVFPS
jgi:hypothetical protein